MTCPPIRTLRSSPRHCEFRATLGRFASALLLSLGSVVLIAGCAGTSPTKRAEPTPESARVDGGSCCEETVAAPTSESTVRKVEDEILPATPLVDQFGRRTTFAEVISGDTPVALDFVFTTCTTICPVMTATFARLHETLGDEGTDLRLVSISLDPEYDTPDVLRAYAEKFGPDARWTFLTGDAERLSELYRRYEVLTGTNKMTHLPFVLFRFPGESEWVRVDGLTGANDLATRYREARPQDSGKVSP